jgi:uncharacterized protein (DUF433 family)
MSHDHHWRTRIDFDEGVPYVRGTSLPVQLVVDAIADGAFMEDLLEKFPELAAADVRACVACSAEALRQHVFTRVVRFSIASVAQK